MKKIITEPIDFTGCIPEVADALKKGLRVKTNKGWINAYDSEEEIYYIFGAGVYEGWKGSGEITLLYERQTETRVKKASEIVKWLEDNGYEVEAGGDWDKKEADCKFLAEMFQFCEKVPDDDYKWFHEWLEEIEV